MRSDLLTLGQRIYWCRNVLLADMDKVDFELSYGRGSEYISGMIGVPTQAEFGVRIASELGRDAAIPAGTVSRWEADKAVPDLLTIQAIGRVCGTDPGWLAFGSKSSAATPHHSLPAAVQAYATIVAERRAKEVKRSDEAQKEKAAEAARLMKMLRALNRRGPTNL